MRPQNLKKVALPDWRTFVSGVLIVFAFPPWNFWPLIWICLIPWFYALQRTQSSRAAVIQGVWLSYFMSLGGFYWVAFVLREFGNLPWILSILALQIFCLFGQPQFFVLAPALRLLEAKPDFKKKPLKTVFLALAVACTYAGVDWILPKIFSDTLGYSLYLADHLRQLVDIGGAALLTFLIYFVNDSLWAALRFRKSALPQLAAALLICTVGSIYGFFRLDQISKLIQNPSKTLQAAAIQGNIGDIDKIAAERGIGEAANQVLSTYTSMSDQAMKLDPKPQIVIWPETSYPSTFRNPRSHADFSLDAQVEFYSKKLGVPLLFGGYDHTGHKDFNALFILTPPDGNLQIYRKNILLLFGEYIPGADTFDIIKETFPQVGNFGRGNGPDVFEIFTKNLKTQEPETFLTGPIICYEALFPNYVIEAARRGSQFIMNVTNDSWFGTWGEPQLHLALTSFRSIETRLPMIRATNTGISTLILPTGEITHATTIGVPQIMNVTVPITPPIPTLMKAWGDWFGLFSLLVGLNLLSLLYRQKRHAKRV